MKNLHFLLCVLTACVLLIRCTEDEPAIDITDIKFDGDKVIVTEGLSYDLNDAITIVGDDADQADISFSSADDAIVSVDGHTLTAEAAGTTTVTATESNSGLTATVEVVVEAKEVAVTGVTLDRSEANLKVGDTFQLTATIAPSDATEKGLTWSVGFPPESKNLEDTPENIATVSKTGLVTAKAAGDVVVTATTTDGEFKENVDIAVTNVAVTGVTISPAEVTLGVNESVQLSATIAPENATDKSVIWSLAMEDLAGRTLVAADPVDTYLEITEDGLLKAISLPCAGCTYQVIATTNDSQKTDTNDVTINVPVTALTIFDGEDEVGAAIENCDDIQFSVMVTPDNASDQSVTWSIEENDAFEIDQTGLVSHIDGYIFTVDVSVKVTATANDGSGIFAAFQNNFTIYGECH